MAAAFGLNVRKVFTLLTKEGGAMKIIERSELTNAKNIESSQITGFKSKGGIKRIFHATRYSVQGLLAGWKYEAAFRQEVSLGTIFMISSIWLAPSLLFAVLMNASILFVWCAELFNSAIEAVADAISIEHHALLGRAKDLGSAGILISILIVILVWSGAIYARFFSILSR